MPKRHTPGDGAGMPAPSAVHAASAEEVRAQATRAALRLLAVRERSTKELSTRLAQKGFAPDVIAWVTESLTSGGWVDDSRFAEGFASSGFGRGMSSRRVRDELLRRGVDPGTAEQVLEQGGGTGDVERARDLARARSAYLADVPRETAGRRIYALLARRGYPPSICDQVTREIMEGS